MLYSCTAVENLARRYYEKGGEVIEVVPGSIGYGITIMYGEGLKTTVVKEVYVNEWSSAHKIRTYKKMPEKYRQMLNDFYGSEVMV